MSETRTDATLLDSVGLPRPQFVGATVYGSLAGAVLMLPLLVVGSFDLPGDLSSAAFLLLLGLLGAYTAALLRTTERARLRRVRSRLKALQAMHEEGLLRDDEFEARRAGVLQHI